MLSRRCGTTHSPMFNLFDSFRAFDELDVLRLSDRSDTIDEEGIKIELPGTKASDLDVIVEGKTLKVSGKSRHGKEFNYVYTLKSTVDSDSITAKFQDGLLSITLQKKHLECVVRKIDIET